MKSDLILIAIFALGFVSAIGLFGILSIGKEIPLSFVTGSAVAPQNWITEEDIILRDDMIIIKVDNARLSYYEATGSMKPVLDAGANGIRIVPESVDKIDVGDIISFRKNGILIVHRIIEKDVDEKGIYFITKGDNNNFNDGKVRFEDIEYVTIGILY